MFKRTEEQEWTRFSKALSGKDKDEPAETAAAEPAGATESTSATEEPQPAGAQPQVQPLMPPPPAPAMPRPAPNDVNVSVARLTQPTPRQSSASNGDIQTVVGPQTTFSGTLRSETSVRILGSIEGEIFSQQSVVIEEQASVKAKVSADSVTVAGEVTGEIQCAGRIEILPTGRVHGEIQAGTLIMQEGAFFEGHLKMGPESEAEAQAAPAPTPSEAIAARPRR